MGKEELKIGIREISENPENRVLGLASKSLDEIIALVTKANREAVIVALREHGLTMQDYHKAVEAITKALPEE